MNWNIGGWFGGQIGATVWMLVAGILTAVRDFQTGMFVVLLFAIPNIIGLILWLSHKFSCYLSTQLLIGVSGLCGLVAVYVLDKANVWMEIQSGEQISAQSTYWIIGLVYVGLMLMFYFRFGLARKGPKA